MGQVCAKELLWALLLRLLVPCLLSLLAVRPHLYRHFSNFSCNLRPRCTLNAGINTREVSDHDIVPMEHKELVGDGCCHVSDTDDGAPSIGSACEGNAEPINEGFAFILDAEVNNRPSLPVACLACRQLPAKEMSDQGGRNVHSVPCLYLFALRVTHHVGTKEGGVHIAGESTVQGARH